ncbi:hypothetical protein TARUN_6134 [Trichoderma arundinaceum]|uniref:Mid2 domain-containing protein n=1 Tax=Trichoderma arundinaceum TaxID=490622 RepID=A0A395NJ21_TRIAR|nr:hypothetical protein TARUN_6134 [Trichoderma arundinaceum]
MTVTSRSVRLLLLVSALASFVSASPTGSLFMRESQCSAGLQSCPAGLPNNFCCTQGTTCIPLAGNTTALCCPTGQSCDKIQPITCDVNQQDPSKSQKSPIKTSIFDVALEKCGTNLCCPFGYSCAGGNQCQKNSDQSKAPESASPSSSAPPSSASSTAATSASTAPTSAPTSEPTSAPTSAEPSSTSANPLVVAPVTTPTALPTEESTLPSLTSSPASSPTAIESSTTPEASSSQPSSPKTASIIGGAIGGCAVLVVLGAIVFLFIRRRNKRSKNGYPEKSGFGKIKHLGPGPQGSSIISDPILQPNSYRADFIRKSPSISSSISQRPPQIVLNHSNSAQRLSIPNPFDSPNPSDHSPTNSQGSISSEDDRNARTGVVGSGSRLAPIRAMKASSTRVYPQNVPREPSGESINVFADPVMMSRNYDKRQTHATTFTDLMIEADLGDVRRGQPYLVPDSMSRI